MTTEASWAYTRNPFVTTLLSYKKMDMMATDHHDKLKNNLGDPEIDNLYHTHFLPAYAAFKDAYTQVGVTQSRYGLRTDNFTQLVSLLGTDKIDDWDIQIQATSGGQFRKNTNNYKMLFPNGRSAYQSEAYEQRILTLSELSTSLGDFPVLATIKTDVDNFLMQIRAARTEQQGFENQLSIDRSTLDNARSNLALAMHKVLGFLIYKYTDNPKRIEDFFELAYIRQTTYDTSGNEEGGTVNEDEPIFN